MNILAYDISVFECIWCLDGFIKRNFEASLQALKPDMTHITSCRKVISIISTQHTASAVFVAFWLVLPFRERKNYIRFSYM